MAPAEATFNPEAYLIYSPIAAGLILGFLIWSSSRAWHSAFGIALVCWWGLGPAGVGIFRYSYLLYGMSSLVLVWMSIRWIMTQYRFRTVPWLMPAEAKVLLVLLVVIWIKSAVDTLRLGLDEFRLQAYYSLVFFALPGAVVIAAAFVVQPWRTVLRQTLLASLVIGGIYFLFGVVGAVVHDPALLMLDGESRMTLHNIDTINAVRFTPMMMLGLFYLVLLRPTPHRVFFAAVAYCALLLVLVLVGTRQIAVSVLLITACAFLVVRRRLIGFSLLGLALLAGLLAANADWMKYTPLVARVEAVGDGGDGRVEIWSKAFEFTRENPLLGGGFRSFGEIFLTMNPETGVISVGRDNAHGIFQDTFTDHGVIVGGLFFLCSIAMVIRGFLMASRSPIPEAKVAGLMPVALWSSLLFSGALYGAWGYYLGLVMCAGAAAGLRGEKIKRTLVPRAAGASQAAKTLPLPLASGSART